MKKELKHQIILAYGVPRPLQKEYFIHNLNYPKTRWYDFLFCQFAYIRKRVWVISFSLFLAILLFAATPQKSDITLLWGASAVFPFLAMTAVTETVRSAIFGMAELEMTTRYSLRSILLARMGMIGVGNLVLLFIVIPILSGKANMSFIKIGIYLLVPYLLACFLSFAVINRIRTKDFSYYCAGIAIFLSGGGLIFGLGFKVIYQPQYFILWLIVLTALAAANYKEIRALIKNSEEMIWNSYLTA